MQSELTGLLPIPQELEHRVLLFDEYGELYGVAHLSTVYILITVLNFLLNPVLAYRTQTMHAPTELAPQAAAGALEELHLRSHDFK